MEKPLSVTLHSAGKETKKEEATKEEEIRTVLFNASYIYAGARQLRNSSATVTL